MIDTGFDLRSDANGRDPDRWSPTLRLYHRLLGCKQLPNNGPFFELDDKPHKGYLHHLSDPGEFVLTSDSVLPTFTLRKRYSSIINQLPIEEIKFFQYITYTIGGMMIFPGNKVDGKMTINGARGFNSKIGDRFDLTLECVRRFYIGEPSPLYEDLGRYENFFLDLFSNFRGYVNFFLLQDLVTQDDCSVKFFTSFDNFASSPLPSTVTEYRAYKQRTISFVASRNQRIKQYFEMQRDYQPKI